MSEELITAIICTGVMFFATLFAAFSGWSTPDVLLIAGGCIISEIAMVYLALTD